MFPEINLLEIIRHVSVAWPRKTTIALVCLLIVAGLLFLFASVDFSKLSSLQLGILCAAPATAFAYWLWSVQPPKTPKGHVGVLVALTAENTAQLRSLRSDFAQHIRDLTASQRHDPPFAFVEYPAFLAEQIQTVDDVSRALSVSRGHFMLWGRAKLRQIGGQTQHYLELDGAVRHGPVSKQTSDKLGKEFSELLPRRLAFAQDNDVFSFLLTSETAGLVARYIIGIAAFLSGNLKYAEQLYRETDQEVRKSTNPFPAIRKIRQRLPDRFVEIHDTQMQRCEQSWRTTRDATYLQAAETQAEAILKLRPSHYGAKLVSAISRFVLRRDVAGAKQRIRDCREENEPTWRYSEAFLLAYSGSLRRAARSYRTAFRGFPELSVPNQSEEFIQEVLRQEPEKTQLYYCLGMINFFAKEDYAAAERDFGVFLEKHPPNDDVNERMEAQRLRREAQDRMRNQAQGQPNQRMQATATAGLIDSRRGIKGGA